MRKTVLVVIGVIMLLTGCAQPNFTYDCARRIYNYPVLTGSQHTVKAPHVVCTK